MENEEGRYRIEHEQEDYFGYCCNDNVIFEDPFGDFETYFYDDPDIPPNSVSNLVHVFRSAWLDPYFFRNRVLAMYPIDDFLPEEFGFMLAIHKILKLEYPSPELPKKVMMAFCVCTGRKDTTLKFSNVFFPIARDCHYRAPVYSKYKTPIQWNITPTFLQLAIEHTVPLPKLYFKCSTHYIDGHVEDEGRFNEDELNFKFYGKDNLPQFPLSFEFRHVLVSYLTRYPLSDGNFWTRVRCGDFEIAFGDDISNGLTKYCHFKWENKFNGSCPPTLSTNSVAEVHWIDDSICESIEIEDENYSGFCPNSNLDSLECVRRTIKDSLNEIGAFIWADKDTSRINIEDMTLLNDGATVILVECNKYCACKRNCPYCLTEKGPFPHLQLFFSPGKGWGVYATEDIEIGTLITTYAGKLVADKDSNPEYYFAIEFNDYTAQNGYDATYDCNIGRFINQSHELKDGDKRFSQPNTYAIYILSTLLETAQIGIFALRKIYRGEELTLFYGENFKMDNKCNCNACIIKRKMQEIR
ncbi:histone-lysine N-methyltransferase EHMT1-like [Histomonas meleagridis]|uniref:histone-lysine N-methyltransferase EHMT1-like n=1 Tax=Histomonas meleagridis TaxID=135588 RepID=UPI00355A2073|nr:histone-lysine N-methyltransferase EHMT1-like [Histomonas meleagridis]KAH0797120.1 histone-lysine N-methyltransferase EHMT1-like [Histomonas meleagridis]